MLVYCLAAAVGMENHSFARVSLDECHLQGISDEFGSHVVGEGPTDDSSTGEVDDRGQVCPTFPGGDVGLMRSYT